MIKGRRHVFKRWARSAEGTAAAEFTLILPILMVLLLGVYDVGNGLMVNQKAITAAQIAADLVARNIEVDDDMVDDIVRAGQLAFTPFDEAPMGIDIVSLAYNEDDEAEIVWRETRNMMADDDVEERAVGLGVEGDGVVVVTVAYHYVPVFGSIVIGAINMRERAFARGRRTAVVCRLEGGASICAAS